MIKARETWIDFAKGISIILVVLGHSGDAVIDHYLSWFRMPLFFMLSGYFFKTVSPNTFKTWSFDRVKRFMIPYFSYGIVFAVISLIINQEFQKFIINCGRLLYGGKVLGGPFTVFWFITCLLLTQLAFGYISRFSTSKQIIIISSSYILAHVLSGGFLFDLRIPWNADVVFITLPYFALGYYARKISTSFLNNTPIIIGSILTSVGFVFMDAQGILTHTMDLKHKVFSNVFLDLVVPICFAVSICAMCYQISKISFYNPIAKLGTVTLAIMYLHVPVNFFIKEIYGIEYGPILFTCLGVFLPLAFHYLFQRSYVLSFAFLGSKFKYST